MGNLEQKSLDALRKVIREEFFLAFNNIPTGFIAETLDEVYAIQETSRETRYNDKVPNYLKEQLSAIGDNPKALFLTLMKGEKYLQYRHDDYYFKFKDAELICKTDEFVLSLKLCKRDDDYCIPLQLCRGFGEGSYWAFKELK